MTAWSAGTQIGPYEIASRIGAGGMGEVWKARDTRLNRTVAVKRTKARHTARFEQEARAIAALNHPHICQIHDVGPDYLVMEFVEGVPIKGPLPVETALKLAGQIASAIEEAHSKNILHRDLKPANILVTSRGAAKLLDFGLAKLTGPSAGDDPTLTIEGTVLGTAAYMSPEQAQGKALDERSDIFSFGVVLYEMLSGKRAFTGASTADVLSAVLRDEPAAADAPKDLGDIIRRCLRKRPEDRFISMAEVRAALERVGTAPTPHESIAVLPFANMSRDADDEYFSDGLAEEIINALVKVPGLKVIARTSAFAFKGQNTDIRKIAEVLGVTNILEGSVRRAGNRIRVTAQLITAADGTHLWSERYDREMADVFAVQDEIAAAITSALRLQFTPAPAARPRRQPNLQAHEAYLRYRFHQFRFTQDSLRMSRECLEQAIALDPDWALPLVGLADHYLASTVPGMAPHEAMPRARELAERALEIDPDLADAHAMLGIVAGCYGLNWNESGRRFQMATAREPVPWAVLTWYSYFHLAPVGRLEEARQYGERGMVGDPLNQILHACQALVLAALDLDEEANATWSKSVEIEPQSWWAWSNFGVHHAIHGRHSEARVCAEKAMAILPASPLNVGLMAGVLRSAGETKRADELLDPLRARSQGAAPGMVNYHLVCGEADAAAEWAEKAVEERHPVVIAGAIRAFAGVFRQSSRWPALLKKMNLPEKEIR